jgi:hypothetical protein
MKYINFYMFGQPCCKGLAVAWQEYPQLEFVVNGVKIGLNNVP